MPDFREAWLEEAWFLRGRRSQGAVASPPRGTHPVGTSLAKETSGSRSAGGSWTHSTQRPLLGDRDTEKRTLVPGPSAAVRVAPVPLPGWGIPGEAGKLGVGTQAPHAWEGGSSPQINCFKCDMYGSICVGREALSRWGHRVCVAGDRGLGRGCELHQEVREGLMRG